MATGLSLLRWTIGLATATARITSGDFNGDGKIDVAVTNTNSSAINLLIGNGDGTFQPKRIFTANVYFFNNSIISADLNRDGKLDLVLNNNNGVGVFLGNGDATFQAEHDYLTFSPSSAPRSLSTGDFNADGIIDVVAVSATTPAISVLFGKGDGTLLPAQNFAAGVGPTVARVADLNSDGKPDLLIGDTSISGATTLPNTMQDACFGCGNPLIADGALCNDGSVCTTGDTCHNHVCVGANLPDGSSCSARANAGGTCNAGACQDTCKAGFADCGGTCTGSSATTRTAAAAVLPAAPGTTCAAGGCVMTEILRGCSTSSPVTVHVKGSKVTAYVSNGYWHASFFADLQRAASRSCRSRAAARRRRSIRPTVVNNCASNSVTDEVVCVGNNTDVYTIERQHAHQHAAQRAATSRPALATAEATTPAWSSTPAPIARPSPSASHRRRLCHHGYQFLDLGTRAVRGSRSRSSRRRRSPSSSIRCAR